MASSSENHGTHDLNIALDEARAKEKSAVALPDELEVVAWQVTDAAGNCWLSWERPKGGLPADRKAEPLITRSQAHSTIAALRADNQDLLAAADADAFVMSNLAARAETAQAELKRLTEEKEALREAASAALHFITNIDNAHPVVRALRQAISGSEE